MTKQLTLEIITPEKQVFQDQVDFVVLPAEKGECGILPGHAHLLTQLAHGELRIKKAESIEHFAVCGGFAEVRNNKISVFAETAEMAKEIDIERARLASEKAKAALSQTVDPEHLASAQASLRRALLRLHISERIGKRRAH